MDKDEIGYYLNKNGISLYGSESALDKNDSLNFLKLLETHNIFVFGGDVYRKEDNHLTSTYDNWYCQKDTCNILESISKAKEYIRNYPCDEKTYFVIVY
jgi:hypothetical protein